MPDTLKKNKISRIYRVILICMAGVGVNMLGSYIASVTGSPLYLDSIGTIIVSCICGYLPGIAVGLLTNIIKILMDHSAIYYGSLNVLIALASSYFYRHGLLKKLYKIPFFILTLSAIGGVLGTLITRFIFGFGTEGISAELAAALNTHSQMSLWASQFIADFLIDLADKAITVAVVVPVLFAMPEHFLDKVRYEGWQQNPLTPLEKLQAGEKRVRRVSLTTKIILLISLSSLVVACLGTVIGYILFTNSIRSDSEEIGNGLATIMTYNVDGDKIREFLEKGNSSPEYNITRAKLNELFDLSKDTQYIYVYQIKEDGCHVVFDIERGGGSSTEPGTVIPFADDFKDDIPLLLEGKEIKPKETNDFYGHLLTFYKPIRNSRGECTAYAATDIDISKIEGDTHIFLAKMISLFLGFFIFILAVGIWLAEYNMIYPVNTMAITSGDFVFDTVESSRRNVEKIKKLKIHTGDEIENLYVAFSKTTEDTLRYVLDINEKNAMISKMQSALIIVLADIVESRDSNTGDHIKKTAAYVKILLEELRRENAFPDLDFSDDYIRNVVDSAPLHDIGKIQIPDAVLNKPGKLTDEEYAIIKTHTTAGAEIIDRVIEKVPSSGYLKAARNMAMSHHEKWDGTGYPKGLKGEEIPLSARVMAVADVFDALVSKRAYKKSFSIEQATDMIVEGKGKQFDPKVVDAFIASLDKFREVAEDFSKYEV